MLKLCPEPEVEFKAHSRFTKAKNGRVLSQPKPTGASASPDRAKKAAGSRPRLHTPSEMAKLVTPDLQGLRRWE